VLLLAAQAAQAGPGGRWGGRRGHGDKSAWLPAGVSKDSVAAIRVTFADGTTVDKPYPPPQRAPEDWQKKREARKASSGGAGGGGSKWRGATKALVLKDGSVVALPKRDKAFNREDVASVTATYADGASKTWTPESGGGKMMREEGGWGARPTSVSIALKNGETITKTMGSKRP
jgi:hypothetical protein